MNDDWWRPVPDYEAEYEASRDGNVRRIGSLKLKKLQKHGGGYRSVTLFKNGEEKKFLVHRIIAATFIAGEQLSPDVEVNHDDGVKTNNHVDNLEVVTPQQNKDHAVATGLINSKGQNNSQATTSEATALAILTDHAAGMGYKRLAKKHGVTWSVARLIASRKRWKHLQAS